jgi:hypothetical protein
MTVRYNFEPILLDASPIPSRFAASLDSGSGGVWLDGEPRPEGQLVYSRRIEWKREHMLAVVYRAGRIVYIGPDRDLDLILRPRRRGQRPTGMPRSVGWRMSRSERRRFVSDPAFASLPVVKPAPVGVWNNGGQFLAVAEAGP